MKFIVLSDVHIGKSDNTDRWHECVDWIIANPKKHKCEVVVNSGDLSDDGSLYQFHEGRKGIEKLESAGYTVLSVPGNHDYGFNGIVESQKSIELYNEYVGEWNAYPFRYDVENTAFVLLDSMKEEVRKTEVWGAQGELGERQLRDLDYLLYQIESEKNKKKVVIVLHHHPFYRNYLLALRDRKLFKKVVTNEEKGKNRVDCIVFGHKHKEHRFVDKEKKYQIGLIYASGAVSEPLRSGKLRIPMVDLRSNKVVNFDI